MLIMTRWSRKFHLSMRCSINLLLGRKKSLFTFIFMSFSSNDSWLFILTQLCILRQINNKIHDKSFCFAAQNEKRSELFILLKMAEKHRRINLHQLRPRARQGNKWIAISWLLWSREQWTLYNKFAIKEVRSTIFIDWSRSE